MNCVFILLFWHTIIYVNFLYGVELYLALDGYIYMIG
jgi:hypothetical protein